MKCPKCGEEVVVGLALFRKRLAEKFSKLFKRPKKQKLEARVEKKKVVKKVHKKSVPESDVKLCASVKKLKSYKKNSNISTCELAKKLGVKDSAIYNWFSGKAKPTKKNRLKIRSLLNGKYSPKKKINAEQKVQPATKRNPWSNLTPEQAQERKNKIAFGIKMSSIERKKQENRQKLESTLTSDPYYQKVKENTIAREKELDDLLQKLAKENPSFHMERKNK